MISSAGEYTMTSIEIYNFHCSYRGYIDELIAHLRRIMRLVGSNVITNVN